MWRKCVRKSEVTGNCFLLHRSGDLTMSKVKNNSLQKIVKRCSYQKLLMHLDLINKIWSTQNATFIIQSKILYARMAFQNLRISSSSKMYFQFISWFEMGDGETSGADGRISTQSTLHSTKYFKVSLTKVFNFRENVPKKFLCPKCTSCI